MGKYEVSRDMITKANAAWRLGITLDSMSFVTGGARDAMPATGISWFESATFVNWLNTSQRYQAAYKFDGSGSFQLWDSGDTGYDATNALRNTLANYVLPSMDEWHKAAYYDPNTGAYFGTRLPTDRCRRPWPAERQIRRLCLSNPLLKALRTSLWRVG